MVTDDKDVGQAECHSRPPGPGARSSISPIVYKIVMKSLTVGVVYLFGYMHWSIAWLIGPVIISVVREERREESSLRRNIAKATAIANEKDFVEARFDDIPFWVSFPDVDRAEWLNRILRQMWPNVNHYVHALIKDKFEPKVAKAFSKFKLHGFRFERIILGTIPPRIGGIKVYDRNVSRDEIVMDLDVFYAGDCDINFALRGVKGGIKDFQIHGMVRVVMKPFLTTKPFVGGLQVFFMKTPTIDFNLVGVADLLNMPGLSDMINGIIVEKIQKKMVLPNKLRIKLSKKVGITHILKMPQPEGVLRVHVVEAKNLMRKDINILGMGKSDPYVIITVGAQEFRTPTVDKNINPKWDYWCEAVLESTEQTFNIELFDEDDMSTNDEKLGRATVEVSAAARKGQVDLWLTLEEAKHGLVHLRLTWLQLSADPADLNTAIEETQLLRVTTMHTALFTVYIDSITNLKHARPQSTPDSYVVASVGDKNEQTKVQRRTDAPFFEQGFTFLVHSPESDTLYLKVMDKKTGTEIGRFMYHLNNLLGKPNMEVDREQFVLQMSGPDSKILLSMSLRILKRVEPLPETAEEIESRSISNANLFRANSVREQESSGSDSNSSPSSPQRSTFHEVESVISRASTLAPTVFLRDSTALSVTPPASPVIGGLVHRAPSVTSSAGEAGLGRIQLTLRYSVQRQRLVVVVHKIMHIPMTDPSNIPDPYVKLYLLPGRSKDSKRRTVMIKDNCNPVYDETFEYVISQAELVASQLEVTVATQKGFLSGGSPVIGQVFINLNECDLVQATTAWMDLLPEASRD